MCLYIFLLLPFLTLTLSQTCEDNLPFYHFSRGAINGIILTDGPTIHITNPFTVPPEAVKRSYKALFRRPAPIIFSQNIALLDVPSLGRVLIDTGSAYLVKRNIRFARQAGLLFQNLRNAGIERSSVDFVFLTHGHIDHVGGLRLPNGSAAFPNATIVIGKREHKFWSNPKAKDSHLISAKQLEMFSSFYLSSIAPYQRRKRLLLVGDNSSPFSGVRFRLVAGHTPGHNAIEFVSQRKRLVIVGDTWLTRADQVRNPEWGTKLETDLRQAYRSRIKLLELVGRRRDMVVVYREEFPGVGFVEPQGHLFDWVRAADERLGKTTSMVC